MAAIVVEGLVKRYRDLLAVDGVSFTVEDGEIFALLGPNGAGKTTTLEILEGLRTADAGRAVVAGVDVRRHPRQVKARIGVQLQDAGFFNLLTVQETVGLFASFHPHPRPVESVLEELSLQEKRRALVRDLSGGQRQRLSIACALVGDPHILFLDEPTTGLDPQARRALWEVIREIRNRGRTVVLTTHYMEEAQVLCDRVAIMDRGRLLAAGTPDELIGRFVPEDRIHVALGPQAASAAAESLPGVSRVDKGENGTVVLVTRQVAVVLQHLVSTASGGQLDLASLRVDRGTLEDVFLQLTGRRLRD
ncbi:MAG: ABC transporter ATP-binding protein [Bacillota bacterium]